jgi:hypothetical protein
MELSNRHRQDVTAPLLKRHANEVWHAIRQAQEGR